MLLLLFSLIDIVIMGKNKMRGKGVDNILKGQTVKTTAIDLKTNPTIEISLEPDFWVFGLSLKRCTNHVHPFLLDLVIIYKSSSWD